MGTKKKDSKALISDDTGFTYNITGNLGFMPKYFTQKNESSCSDNDI